MALPVGRTESIGAGEDCRISLRSPNEVTCWGLTWLALALPVYTRTPHHPSVVVFTQFHLAWGNSELNTRVRPLQGSGQCTAVLQVYCWGSVSSLEK